MPNWKRITDKQKWKLEYQIDGYSTYILSFQESDEEDYIELYETEENGAKGHLASIPIAVLFDVVREIESNGL